MNFFSKMERKFGKYAIHNLMYYIIILYGVGIFIQMINPMIYYEFLALDASKVLHGQVWRLVTFIIVPPSSGIFFNLLALYLYYMLGTNLERVWGAFRFNVYFFMGILGHILAAIFIYLIFGNVFYLDTFYLNMSLFFAFAATYPDLQFLLFFVIPVKAKWLAVFNGIYFLYIVIFGDMAMRVAAILSFINFIVFFLMTRNYNRINPKEIKRKQVYQSQIKQAQTKTHHKCAVCGRTEKDEDNLEFRFCSKCEGNYEYCQEHLYTHRHVVKNDVSKDSNTH